MKPTIMQVVAQGLRNPEARIPYKKTIPSLGDRSTYVGASSATGCLRKSYLEVTEIFEQTDEQTLIFERGHQLEEMIRKGLNGAGYAEYDSIKEAKGLNLIWQHEVMGKGKYDFLKAHIDFIFVKQKAKEIIVGEIKSTGILPLEAWPNHVQQINLQMFLLKTTYPEYNVRGMITYHNWDTGASIEYPIQATTTITKIALEKSIELWISMKNKQEPAATIQMYCSSCPFKGNCPALDFGAQLPKEIAQYVEIINRHKKAEKEVKEAKANITAYLQAAGMTGGKCGDNTIQMITFKGKKTVSIDRLKKEHRELYQSLSQETGGYTVIKII